MRTPIDPAPLAARFVGAVFGFVFFGVGLTVIIFLWSAGDGFGSPPLIFRVVGSFIAIAFMAMGGTLCIGSILGSALQPKAASLANRLKAMGQGLDGPPLRSPYDPSSGAASAKYVCPNCGAALGEKTDVSPLGDSKCPFCGAWFNIHGRTA